MSNLFARIIKINISLLVFLLPIFWLPFSFESFEFNKQYLLFFLASLTFLVWLAKQVLFDKEIKFKRTPLDLPIAGFLAVAVASFFFSVDAGSSLFGFYGRFSDGLISLLSLGLMYFLITNNIDLGREKSLESRAVSLGRGKAKEAKQTQVNPEKEFGLLSMEGLILMWKLSAWVAVIFSYLSVFGVWQILNRWLGGKIPQIMLQNIFNPTAGSFEGLAIFLASVIVFLAGSVVVLRGKKRVKIADSFLLCGVLFLLLIIDFTPAWIIVLLSSLFFVGFSLWKRLFRENVNRLLLPISLMAIGIVFLFAGTPGLVQNLFGEKAASFVSLPREPVLSQSASWAVATKASVGNLKSVFLGSGLGTWHYDFAKFKPVQFNQSLLWQIRFDRSGNHISEILGTEGILGILSYFFLIGLFAWLTWTVLMQKPQSLISGIQLPILLALLAMLIGQFVYYQNAALAFSFWLMLSLAVASWQKPIKEYSVSFKDFPEMALIFSIILIIFGLAFLTIYFFMGKIYLADVNYRQAIERGEIGLLERAVNLNPDNSQYKIILSRAYFNQVLAESQKPEGERDQSLFSKNIYFAITYLKGGRIEKDYMRGATEISPNRVAAWESLAMIYRDIQGLAGGALDWSVKSFESALLLEPTNPVLHTELGKLYLASSETEKARMEFKAAKELKSDYPDAVIQIALLYEKENNLGEAIREMESLANFNPYNIDILFQLGRLYFNNKETDKAINQFQTIILLVPNHSNAHYSLGIAYQAKEEADKALAEFERVLELNPGNADVQAKIDELKSE